MGEWLGVSIAILSSCLGGTAAAITRYLVSGADPIALAILRWGIGFLCVLPAALLLKVRWPERRDVPWVMLLGFCFFGLFFVFYNIAMSYTTAARASLALATLPLSTMVVGALLGYETLSARKTTASASPCSACRRAHYHHHHHHHRDNNFRAAYIHVLADAATSVLAIAALVIAMLSGWTWTDPAVGLIGSVVIASWAYTLIRDAGSVLLDVSFDRTLESAIRARLEKDDDRITDLHVWQLGPGHCAAVISLVSDAPLQPASYKERLGDLKGLSHVTVEVERCMHRAYRTMLKPVHELFVVKI